MDRQQLEKQHPIYGMPILLKDNINTQDMPTTAGAAFLQDHTPENDAFVVSQLQSKGALILGKVNLSEWAYYFCDGCPLGCSKNILRRRLRGFGSGVAAAVNYQLLLLAQPQTNKSSMKKDWSISWWSIPVDNAILSMRWNAL